ncbi:MAG: glucosidase [Planctomycetes bacterium]|nr:glucosidase [Planctomycetota bacterium]
MDAEAQRLAQDARREQNWKRFGPYLSERQWGTVREDYSADGNCWDYFPHDHARSRAYRWGEDGLLGITDRECRLCFALALWNGKDPILKERLFGLSGPEGNHGEDVKEAYWYLDSTPTHSYMKALYKYPQAEFPYARLVAENGARGKHERELELEDLGLFDEGRYFDVVAEYAKAAPEDLLVRITITNRGPESARLHLLPTLWFRNTWSWGCEHEGCWVKPILRDQGRGGVTRTVAARIVAKHATLGAFELAVGHGPDGAAPELLFTDNESNTQRLFGVAPLQPHVKDAFHHRVVNGDAGAVNPKRVGTKTAAWYVLDVPAGAKQVVKLRLTAVPKPTKLARPGTTSSANAATAAAMRDSAASTEGALGREFDRVFRERIAEADIYFAARQPAKLTTAERAVTRQAYAGLLWSKQFYHYVVEHWLDGDRDQPTPPESRRHGRNHEWHHLFNRDVLSMPDKWEYPWYAAWDLAFHMLPFARIDPHFAKEQLVLFLREWYMHPNGQIPAYEFALGDVNPPVHAWSAWRVYKLSAPAGKRDRVFLERVFQKLLINFTWWVNRKDAGGRNLFSGGFLGLDNIGVFDRSKPLPTGGHLEQADGTAWMAFYCTTMLSMALELAKGNAAYEDLASKFFEHFVAIVDAMNSLGGTGLWDDEEGFYYDQLHVNGAARPLRVRSMVGLIPLFAVEVLDDATLEQLPGFKRRMQWFLENRKDLARHVAFADKAATRKDGSGRTLRLLAIPSRERLERVLRYLLDESEFLSPYGIRSLSKAHERHPYVLHAGGEEFRVDYAPGESTTGIFGGNSNWRGPIWMPVNYLLIEALERYHHFYGDEFKVECPVGSGKRLTLQQVAREIAGRVARIFLPDGTGARPCHGGQERFASDPAFRDLALFHEYFHAETGRGLGASHQTGWTALVIRLIDDLAHARG